jgi:hypothetical protein
MILQNLTRVSINTYFCGIYYLFCVQPMLNIYSKVSGFGEFLKKV